MMSTVSSRSSTWRSFAGLRLRRLAPAALALTAALLVLSGCASGNTTAKSGNTGNGAASPTATTAQATPTKTKPSAVPQITLAYCQSLVSLADVNNVMKPASPATTITPDNARPGGSCSYISGTDPSGLDFTLFFQPFPQGTSLSAIAQQGLQQAAAKKGLPPGITATITPLSGIGDQAIYASFTGTFNGISGFYDAVYTTLGSVYLSCFNFGIGSSPTTPQQPALPELCTQAVNRM